MTRAPRRLTLADAPDLLKPSEVRELVRVGKNQLYRDLKAGIIPSVEVGGSRRVLKSALIEFLQGRSG